MTPLRYSRQVKIFCMAECPSLPNDESQSIFPCADTEVPSSGYTISDVSEPDS